MSSFNAALLVICILVIVGGPLLWWVFFRMDLPAASEATGESLPTAPLSTAEISEIETSLGVKLPEAYRSFLTSPREHDIDGESIFADSKMIISTTREYRSGFEGLSPWPHHLIYIGDEADACPYALDVESGSVLRTDKGNWGRKPLKRFDSFAAFLKNFS